MATFIYRKGREGRSYSNILFQEKWPMKYGKFPKPHPCADEPAPLVIGPHRMKQTNGEWQDIPGEQPESNTALGRFRGKGYWASCFPEGDGITFDQLKGQDDETIMLDIAECFDCDVFKG